MHDFIAVFFGAQPGGCLGVPDLEGGSAGLGEDCAAEGGVGVVSDVAAFVEEAVLIFGCVLLVGYFGGLVWGRREWDGR